MKTYTNWCSSCPNQDNPDFPENYLEIIVGEGWVDTIAQTNTGLIVEWSRIDCNNNGILDSCELDDNDCNTNGIPDDCEEDCDRDGIIDDCEIDTDQDGIPDDCDADDDGDGIEDACDATPLGLGGLDPASGLVFDPDVDGSYRLILPYFVQRIPLGRCGSRSAVFQCQSCKCDFFTKARCDRVSDGR